MIDKKLKTSGFTTKDEVLKTVLDSSHNIQFIRIFFPDILGRNMDFSIPSYT